MSEKLIPVTTWTEAELEEKPWRAFMYRRIWLVESQERKAEAQAKVRWEQEQEAQGLAASGLREVLVAYYKIVQRSPEMAQEVVNNTPGLADLLNRLPYNPLIMYQPFETDYALLTDGNMKSSPVRFHEDQSPIRVVVTGNRCSKTFSGAADVISHCMGIDPVTKRFMSELRAKSRHVIAQPYWVVSDTEDASKQVAQATYNDLIPEDYLADTSTYSVENGWRGNRITFRNGSQIEFRFSSQGRNTFQGTYRNIHLDEEPPKEIYQECYARTTPVGGRPRGRMIITFTPIYNPRVGISWIQTDLYAKRHEIKGISFHFWTLHDVPNEIIPLEEKEDIISGYEPDERDVRVLGLFTPVGMQLAFARDLIAEQRAKALDGVDHIIDTETVFTETPVKEIKYAPAGSEIPTTTSTHEVYKAIETEIDDGEVVIFSHPVARRNYVVGADPAEGLAHGDDSCACVLDAESYEQVAEIQCKLDPDEFGDLLFRVGRYYNDAYIGIENVSDLTPLYALSRMEYPNIHYQCVLEGKPYDKQTDKMGWNTNTRTRRILRNDALQVLRDGSARILSHRLLDQMEIFARNPKGRYEAIAGGHDDLVFAWMIAVQMIKCWHIVEDLMLDGQMDALAQTADDIENTEQALPHLLSHALEHKDDDRRSRSDRFIDHKIDPRTRTETEY